MRFSGHDFEDGKSDMQLRGASFWALAFRGLRAFLTGGLAGNKGVMFSRDYIHLFPLITSNFLNVVSIAIDALALQNGFVLQTAKAAGPPWGCTLAVSFFL